MKVHSSDFFSRQAALHSIGEAGLRRLGSCSVGIAGVGGVGSSAAYYLAASGIGRLTLVDQDILEPSNLQRVHGTTSDDLYHPKAEILARAISDLGFSSARAIVDTVTNSNVGEIFDGINIVVDGLDNFRSRYVLNRFALRNHVPYLFASAVADQAHLALLSPPDSPCLECIMPNVVDRVEDSCERLGVSPSITGLTGTLAASAVIQFLLRLPTRLREQLLTVDMAGPDFLFTRLSRRESCTVCSDTNSIDSSIPSPSVSLLCGERTANVLPPPDFSFQLSSFSPTIPKEKILLNTESVLVFKHGQFVVSVFRNGRLLISGVSDETQASLLAQEVWEAVLAR